MGNSAVDVAGGGQCFTCKHHSRGYDTASRIVLGSQRATIWIAAGHATYLGPSLRLDAHSGSVDCFALGIDNPFVISIFDDGEVDRCSARTALIPARTRHHVAGDGWMLFWFVDPSSRPQRSCETR